MSRAVAYVAGQMARLARKVRDLVEVILHIGAHRTGTTTFQHTIQRNRHKLTKSGIEFWGPQQTRSGRLDGLLQPGEAQDWQALRRIERSRGAVAIALKELAKKRCRTLVVSEENLVGSTRSNLRTGGLYDDLGPRLERAAAVFGPSVRRIGLAIRPYDEFWTSSLAYALPRGHHAPDDGALDRLVTHPRGWRDVIGDVAAAFRGAEVVVWEFGRLAGRAPAQLRLLTRGTAAPAPWMPPGDLHANRAPRPEDIRQALCDRGERSPGRFFDESGRFSPFGPHHVEAFRARYSADLDWLRGISGAALEFSQADEVSFAPATINRKRSVG